MEQDNIHQTVDFAAIESDVERRYQESQLKKAEEKNKPSNSEEVINWSDVPSLFESNIDFTDGPAPFVEHSKWDTVASVGKRQDPNANFLRSLYDVDNSSSDVDSDFSQVKKHKVSSCIEFEQVEDSEQLQQIDEKIDEVNVTVENILKVVESMQNDFSDAREQNTRLLKLLIQCVADNTKRIDNKLSIIMTHLGITDTN
jgi:hypothetical protein